MLWLYILLGIVIFFTLILLIPVKLDISSTDKTELYLKILFIKIKLSPRKKKINIKKYSPKAMEKARKKAEKKALAKQKKILKKKVKPQKTKEKKPSKIKEIFKHPTDIPAFVTDVYDIISILVGKFSKRIKINVKSCNVIIGTDNAAKTAIVYGAVCVCGHHLELLRIAGSCRLQVVEVNHIEVCLLRVQHLKCGGLGRNTVTTTDGQCAGDNVE